MARKDWYTVKVRSTKDGYDVLKVNEDFKHTGTYQVDANIVACTCFAGNKSTCRHRDMVKMYATNQLLDSGRYYNFDKRVFYEPPAMEM